jgi:sodium/proline symporter
MQLSVALAFFAYLLFMIGIGVFFSKKSSNVSDYFLGGRGMGSWLTALSAQASDMSSWLLMGLPGAVYLSGVGESWIAIGLALGTYLNWLLVAKRLRKYSYVANDSITIPQYFQNRFNSQTPVIRVACAVIIFIFFLVYTASSFNAAAKLLLTVFGIKYNIGLTVGVIVILAYTITGGYFAVVWTDFFQGMLMFVALMAVPIIAYTIVKVDLNAMMQQTPEFFSMTHGESGVYSWQYIASNLAWGLGYFGMPHILVRFMSIKNSSMITKSRRIAIVWVVITLFAAVMVGVTGKCYIAKMGLTELDSVTSETVFMVLVQKLTPGFIAGILLCAIVAAIMSTSDSQLLVTASAVSNDIYKTLFNKNATDKQLLMLSRGAVLVIAVMAYFLALNPENSVMGLVSYAWAGLGAAFGPAILISLYWKRMTANGAVAGIITGGAVVIIWGSFLKDKLLVAADGTQVYELLPAFIISSIVIVVVSLLSKKPDEKVIADFEKVKTVEV